MDVFQFSLLCEYSHAFHFEYVTEHMLSISAIEPAHCGVFDCTEEIT